MKHLLFVEQSYSFPILRPLEKAAIERGDQVGWFLYDLPAPEFLKQANVLSTIKDVEKFDPDSVIAPGNWVPHFFPGLKVQVFHGFGIEKKGHFKIRGLFDLYCTHGPMTTAPFEALQRKHAHFDVVETGWPKLDPWAQIKRDQPENAATRQVLYAPTFSPSLTSAKALLEEWREIAKTGQYSIVVKFHPLEDPQTIAAYRGIGGKLVVVDTADILGLISQSDMVVSDTSSAVAESLVLGVPVLAFRPKVAGAHTRNFFEPNKLAVELDFIFSNYPAEKLRGKDYGAQMHPYRDGRSSLRVLDAIKDCLSDVRKPARQKPWNLFRKMKIDKKMQRY